jgi:hypothetical protein
MAAAGAGAGMAGMAGGVVKNFQMLGVQRRQPGLDLSHGVVQGNTFLKGFTLTEA